MSLKHGIPALLTLVLLLTLCTCTTRNLLFSQKTGAIAVTSDPAGAAILLDHGLTGTATPDTLFDVAAGDHVVSVMQSGYLTSPESLVVTVEEDQMSSAEFVLLETSKGSLEVTSNVGGAVICIDNQPTAEATPHVFFNAIPVGTHVISVFKEGYANDNPTKEIVEIVTKDTAKVNFTLTPAETGLEPGMLPPDFELEDDLGFWRRFYAYRGYVTIVNFWAVSCNYCMLELPYLEQLHMEYSADSLIILGVNYEDGFNLIRQTRESEGLSFILLKGVGTDVIGDYNALPAPITVFIDRDGTIYHYDRGFQTWEISIYRQKLDELFGK
jgi:thiol-disulfide isomerase/thioredoxin